MVQVQPQNLTEFGKLSGVGSHKLSQYGDKFITEIRAYRQEKGLVIHLYFRISIKSSSYFRHRNITLQLHQQGLDIDEIAKKRNLSPTTVIHHLTDWIQKNQPVDLNQLVPLRTSTKNLASFEKYLVYILIDSDQEQLGESYTFDEIRLVRGKWRRENRK